MRLTVDKLAAFAEALIKLRDTATDEAAAENSAAYDDWDEAETYAVGDRVQYEGELYKCLTAHTAQITWTPAAAPSLWAKVLPGQGGTAIGEWVQPDSTNPYMSGDKVTCNGKTWISTIDKNVWQPGVYGWHIVSEGS